MLWNYFSVLLRILITIWSILVETFVHVIVEIQKTKMAPVWKSWRHFNGILRHHLQLLTSLK